MSVIDLLSWTASRKCHADAHCIVITHVHFLIDVRLSSWVALWDVIHFDWRRVNANRRGRRRHQSGSHGSSVALLLVRRSLMLILRLHLCLLPPPVHYDMILLTAMSACSAAVLWKCLCFNPTLRKR